MAVKLHKVTLYIVEDTEWFDNNWSRFVGDMDHNGGFNRKAVEHQVVEFDRSFNEDDPLNQTSVLEDKEALEKMLEGQPVKSSLTKD